jgi:hypothetical protein
MNNQKNVIQFNNGKVSEGINQREREAMFNFYQDRREENYNPATSWILLLTVGWLAVYGAYQAVLNFIVPIFKMIF